MRFANQFCLFLVILLGIAVQAFGGNNGGTALNFDGANDYVSFPVINLSASNALTLEAWIKPSNLTNSAYSEIIRQQGAGTTDWLLAFQTNGTVLTFGLRAGGNFQQLYVPINASDFTDGNWHHIAATYDGAATRLFRDGRQIGASTQTGNVSFTGTAAAIGASFTGFGSEFFNGAIDEVRVWSIARSAAELKLYMGQSLTGTETGLAAYWRFDEGTGTTAGDATGNDHNGILVNGPLWINSTAPIGIPLVTTLAASAIATNTATFNGLVNPNGFETGFYFEYGTTTNYGNKTPSISAGSSSNSSPVLFVETNLTSATAYHYRTVATNFVGTNSAQDQLFFTAGPNVGFALSFDGINDYVSAAPVNLTNSRALTIEAWIKPANLTDTAFSEIIRQQGGSDTDWLLAFQTNGTLLTFGLRTSVTNYQELRVPITPGDFTDGAWHHIAAIYDGGTKALYKDGVIIGSTAQSGNISSAGSNVFIGATVIGGAASECFSGLIDEVRVWQVARTASQINQNLNLGLIGTDAGLAAYWHLDEGAGTSTGDGSGHGYTATLVNGPLWVPSTSPVLPFTASPLLVSSFVNNITTSSILLNGLVNPDGLPTTVYFEFGATTNYGNHLAQTNLGSQLIPATITASVSNLLQANRYHWRLVAGNSAGTNYGPDHAVFTSGPGLGSTLKLNGVNQYVSLTPIDLRGGTGMSVEAWIKPTNLTATTFSEISRQEGSGQVDWLLSFQNNATFLSFGLRAGAVYQELRVPIDASTLADGSWHHVAASYDGSIKTIYVDGVAIGFANASGQVSFAGLQHAIGANGPGSAEYFNGFIDEVRLWRIARTFTQINQFMNSGLVGTEPGLAGYWRFDEAGGTTSLDSTGGGNTATLKNGPLWSVPDDPLVPVNGPPFVSTANATNLASGSTVLNGTVNPNGLTTLAFFQYGTTTNYGLTTAASTIPAGLVAVPLSTTVSSLQSIQLYNFRIVASNSTGVVYGTNKSFTTSGSGAGYALSFDGVNDYVGLPLMNLNGASALTIEAWIKPASLASAYSEIIRQTRFSGNDWLLSFQNNGTFLSFGLTTAVTGYQELRAPINPAYFTDANWHHVAVTYDGSIKRLYVDGIQIASTNQSGSITSAGTTHTIGSTGGASEFFNGFIDEVRFWNIARSPAQIAQYRNQNVPATEPGLLHYWRFDEGTGTTAGDSTDAAGNGTLVNGPVWVNSTAPINLFGGPPSITRSFTSASFSNSVSLAATVFPGTQGAAVYFEYGFTTNYGNQTLPVNLAAAQTPVSFTNTLSGLTAQKVYHWHAVATNATGATYGPDHTFMTSDSTSGWALGFNGTSSYLSLPLVNLSSGSGLTIEAWIKPFALTNLYSEIVRQTGPQGPDWMLAFQSNGGILAFGLKTSVGGYQEMHVMINPASLTDGNWHHVAAVYDGTEKRIYIDGAMIGSTSQAGSVAFASTGSTIAASLEGGLSEFYNGLLDEVRIWGSARTPGQLVQFMNQNLSGSETGLAAYWRFDEGTGFVVGDSSSNGKTAGMINGPVWVPSNAPLIPFSGSPVISGVFTLNSSPISAALVGSVTPGALGAQVYFEYGLTTNYDNQLPPMAISGGFSPVTVTNVIGGLIPQSFYHWRFVASNEMGKTISSDRLFVTVETNSNSALSFDGINDFVSVPTINFATSNKLTIEAWLLPFSISASPNSEIIRQQVPFGNPDYLLAFQNSGSILSFGLGAGGAYAELRVSVNPSVISDGKWHHVAAVYDGTVKMLYLDGVQIGATPQSGPIGGGGTINSIGSYAGTSEFFNGAIDEVRIWSVARTSGEINQNLNRVVTGNPPGLEAYWRFDDFTGNTALDSSGKGRNGTLNNGPTWFTPGAPVLLIAPPGITNFTPPTGQYGSVVTLWGINLLTVTNVTINGSIATFAINSDSSVNVTIPVGATTGPFTIRTLYGQTVSASNFIVDNSPPLLAFQNPTPGTFLSSLPLISGTSSDVSGIRSVVIYIQRAGDSKFWTGSGWGTPTALATSFSNGLWSNTTTLPAGLNLLDGSYTLFATSTDNAGNSSDINARITVNKAGTVVPITRLANGHPLVRFPGAAGQSYRLQMSTNLLDWSTLQAITVDTTGILSYEDISDGNFPVRFYRTVTP